VSEMTVTARTRTLQGIGGSND